MHVHAGTRASILIASALVLGAATGSPAAADSSDLVTPRATQYAHAFGVSIDVAQERIDRQDAIGELGADLEEEFPETWAGLWIEQRPL